MEMKSCFFRLKSYSRDLLIPFIDDNIQIIGSVTSLPVTRFLRQGDLKDSIIYFRHEGEIGGKDYSQIRMRFLLSKEESLRESIMSGSLEDLLPVEVYSRLFSADLDIEPSKFRDILLGDVHTKIMNYSTENGYNVLGYIPYEYDRNSLR
jgi:hypothetical protein